MGIVSRIIGSRFLAWTVLAVIAINGAVLLINRARAQIDGSASESAEVQIYTTQTCSECLRAKHYLRANGIAYKEFDVEGDMALRKKFYAIGGKAVPLLFVRGRRMEGFDPTEFNRLYTAGG